MPAFMFLIFLIPLAAVIGKSPIGDAIADAIRHNSGANKSLARRDVEEMRVEMEHLRAELDGVHQQLLETAERLDFAERMLSTHAITDRRQGELN